MATTTPDRELPLLERRSSEWREHQLAWRWLLDSLEGGDRYRQAVYGYVRGLPVRNLIRHKREYPDPREYPLDGRDGATYLAGSANGMAGGGGPFNASDPAQYADVDDYELRRARTPVPAFVGEVVETYCSKVFAAEIDRDAPDGPPYDALAAWWADVDGLGTCVDDWMADTIGPLLLTLGQLDLVFDHPEAPGGEQVATAADVKRTGINRCVASYILPENMVWWRLNPDGTYAECLHLEYPGGSGDFAGQAEGRTGAYTQPSQAFLRHWTAADSTLYSPDGEVVRVTPHRFGRVPVRRVFDRRKPRCQNVGVAALEFAAECQREFYNRDSELILSDSTHAHPLLQGPEDYVQADGTVPIGPNWLLPKKKNVQGGTATYEGFDVVDFPKGAAESLRQNKADIRDALDRRYCLMKPAGAANSGGGSTVAQSGVSKSFDHDGLHAKLSRAAKVFGQVEAVCAEMALAVLTDGKVPADAREKVTITYPTVFNLYAADQLANIAVDFQSVLAASGAAPETETAILSEIVRKALPGRDDEAYETYDAEIAEAVKAAAARPDPAADPAADPNADPNAPAAGQHPLGDGWEEDDDEEMEPGEDD